MENNIDNHENLLNNFINNQNSNRLPVLNINNRNNRNNSYSNSIFSNNSNNSIRSETSNNFRNQQTCNIHLNSVLENNRCLICSRERMNAYSNYTRLRNLANSSNNNLNNTTVRNRISSIRARLNRARENMDNVLSITRSEQENRNRLYDRENNPNNFYFGSNNNFRINDLNYRNEIIRRNQNNNIRNQNTIENENNDRNENFNNLIELEDVPVPIKLNKLNTNSSIEIYKNTENINENNNKCIICYENFENDCITRKMTCRHLFHIECIDRWFETKNWCPLCRKVFN